MRTLIILGAALACADAAHAQLQVSLGIRETEAGGGGPFTGIGTNGGTAGGIEWVNLDGQTLILDGTWQQFTFNITTDQLTAFAGATANGILDGTYGVLEHIRFRNSGGLTHNINIWIDDVANSYLSPAGGPVTTVFGDFEGYGNGTEVMFQEPSFSGSTNHHLMPGSTAGVDNSVAYTGSASYALSFQFVDDLDTRWLRLTTFNADNTPNPQILFNQESVITFWAMGVPEPGTIAVLGMGLLGRSRRRKA